MQKVLETLKEQEKTQAVNKLEIVRGCIELTNIVQELGEKTGITCNALDEKLTSSKTLSLSKQKKLLCLNFV